MTKQERVRLHVRDYAPANFTIERLRQALPDISDKTIRLVLAAMRRERLVDPTTTAATRPGRAPFRALSRGATSPTPERIA